MTTTTDLPAYQYLTLPGNSKLAYLDVGPKTAPVLLFLHGMGDHAMLWEPAMAALQPNYRCIALDLPGHGKSYTNSFNCRMFDYAAAIIKCIELLKLPPLTLIGHSMGGQIAVVMALSYAAQVEKLVLVAPAGFEQFTETEKRMLLLGASFGNSWNAANKNGNTNTATKAHILQKSLEGMLAEPVFDHLKQLQQPTQVIFGSQDPLIPNRYLHHQTTALIAQQGAAQIPGAELHLLKKCGHYPQMEQTRQFITLLRAFIKK